MLDIKNQLLETNKLVDDLHRIVTEIEGKITEPSAISEKPGQIPSALQSMKNVMTFQTRKIADLEGRSRRSNLIIHGIPEGDNETEADLMGKIVDDLFKTKLAVKCQSTGRIHRIGKQPW